MKRDPFLPKDSKKCAFLSDVLELEEDSLPDNGLGNPDGPANPNDLDDPAYDCRVHPTLEVLISFCKTSGCNCFFIMASCAARMLSFPEKK
ncbi:unnamed protein product [Euphydryas editha]|uniref:Uncharacterized protein n=1 Tax=Euphydryas editha TaxID=104508 RepID=A0AAU9TUB3_EUPED|nr:unnamed protein product [Euphydryas editha]